MSETYGNINLKMLFLIQLRYLPIMVEFLILDKIDNYNGMYAPT